LAQLFQNLLSNAIKYRRPDVPLRIEVKAVRESEFWRLSVRDNGIGIDHEWLERIFLPLQRRSRADISGSGIGLATCKKIVGRAGGRIWAESELGEGATFNFTLPSGSE
jgi:signal transduction histidine kinase